MRKAGLLNYLVGFFCVSSRLFDLGRAKRSLG